MGSRKLPGSGTLVGAKLLIFPTPPSIRELLPATYCVAFVLISRRNVLCPTPRCAGPPSSKAKLISSPDWLRETLSGAIVPVRAPRNPAQATQYPTSVVKFVKSVVVNRPISSGPPVTSSWRKKSSPSVNGSDTTHALNRAVQTVVPLTLVPKTVCTGVDASIVPGALALEKS